MTIENVSVKMQQHSFYRKALRHLRTGKANLIKAANFLTSVTHYHCQKNFNKRVSDVRALLVIFSATDYIFKVTFGTARKICLYLFEIHLVFYKQPVHTQLALGWQIAKQLSVLNSLSLRNNKNYRSMESGVFPL